MGSAAVFGSITAYLLMSGGSPAETALHSTSHMKIADATDKDVTPEDAPTLVSWFVVVANHGQTILIERNRCLSHISGQHRC